MIKFLKSQQGMSLVSVMVAIGLTGVLAVILMNLSEQQARQQKKAMIDGELSEILNNFRSILSSSDSCNASFAGKKKGQKILNLYLNTKGEPFAEVSGDTPFRSSKLLLTDMRLLRDDQVNKIEGLKAQEGIVVFEASFQKPDDILGGKVYKKQFEFRALYGQTEIIYHPAHEQGVVQGCKKKFGPQAFIRDLVTWEKAEPEESGVEPMGTGYMGECVYVDENSSESSVIHCVTAK